MSDEQTQMDIEWDEGDDKSSVVYVGTSRESIGLTELGLASDLQDSEMEDDEDSKKEDDEDSKKEDDEDSKKKMMKIQRRKMVKGRTGREEDVQEDSEMEGEEDSVEYETDGADYQSSSVSYVPSEQTSGGLSGLWKAGDSEREEEKGVTEGTAAAVQPKVRSKGPAKEKQVSGGTAAAVKVKVASEARIEQVTMRRSRSGSRGNGDRRHRSRPPSRPPPRKVAKTQTNGQPSIPIKDERNPLVCPLCIKRYGRLRRHLTGKNIC